MQPLKVIELFGGIGACTKALERLGIPHNVIDYVEIDKFAVASYNAIYEDKFKAYKPYGTQFRPQDVTKWDKCLYCEWCGEAVANEELDSWSTGDNEEIGHGACQRQVDDLAGQVDLLMHGSPCQDFSAAGLGKGGDEGSGTRSSLMYETLRIVAALRPKVVIWENVKNVLSHTHKHNFDAYQKRMEELGYTNYYQVLNAKDYGIPQNRERVFTVSILGGGGFEFPTPIPLTTRLKDILEPSVDESFYLSTEQVQKIKMSHFNQERTRIQNDDVAQALLARDWKDPKCVKVGDLDIKGKDCIKRVYSPEGLSPTITTMGGGNREPKITEPFIAASRGRNPENPSDRTTGCPTEQRLEPKFDGTTNTLTSVQKDNYVVEPPFRIRKLTPKECWRLMGFDDEDYEKAAKVNSKTQLYKQAGNSIVVNVLEAILRNLYPPE